MKIKFFSLIFGVIMLTATVFAGTPQTQQGAKSLFFGFNGLSNLSVDNTYLGCQYLFADKMGVWADLSLGFKTEKPTETAKDVKDNAIGFDIGFMYYAFQKGPIAVYLSPQFGISNATAEDENSQYKKTTNYFHAGVSIGTEWWAFENISFGVSTYLGFESNKVTTEVSNSESESTSSNIGILGSSSGNIWISFYF